MKKSAGKKIDGTPQNPCIQLQCLYVFTPVLSTRDATICPPVQHVPIPQSVQSFETILASDISGSVITNITFGQLT